MVNLPGAFGDEIEHYRFLEDARDQLGIVDIHLDRGRTNQRVLDVVVVLADQYRSRIIGIAACQPVLLGDCDGYMDRTLAVATREIS